MEVTALKGSSGDLQHFADRIFAERGVRYGRVAMIPTSAKTKRRPKAYLTIETPVVACPFRVNRVTLTLRQHFRSCSVSGQSPRWLACLKGAMGILSGALTLIFGGGRDWLPNVMRIRDRERFTSVSSCLIRTSAANPPLLPFGSVPLLSF